MRQILRFFAALMLLAGSVSFFIGARPDLLLAMREAVSGKPVTAPPQMQEKIVIQAAPPPVMPQEPEQNQAEPVHALQASPMACIETPTSVPVAPAQAQIYQWVDERGTMHFGDRPPASIAATLIDAPDQGRMEYFTLEIDYGGAGQVPFLHDRLRVNASQIFDILAGMIGEERLRTVDLTIRVLPDREAFLAWGGQYLDANIDAYYSAITNESVTWQHDSPDYTLQVAVHESVHVILAGLFGGGIVPNWLNEGLAEYFEMMEPRASYNHIPVDWRSARVVQLVTEQNGRIPLAQLMDAELESWNRNMQVFYPLTASLVFYLMDSEQGREMLKAVLAHIADNYCQQVDVSSLLDESYPGGLPALEDNFYHWLASASPSMYHRL